MLQTDNTVLHQDNKKNTLKEFCPLVMKFFFMAVDEYSQFDYIIKLF